MNGNNNTVLFLKFLFSRFLEAITAEVVQPKPIDKLNKDFPVKPIFFNTPLSIKATLLIKPDSSKIFKNSINKTICGKNEKMPKSPSNKTSKINVLIIGDKFMQEINPRKTSKILLKINSKIDKTNPPTGPNVK